ncbi:MAG: type I toxin-antitoxin system Fst family toxin [Lactobacillus sp.]|nr:type I toxin-antitoxin system Fst family toxin [Lactobacillus sp.]
MWNLCLKIFIAPIIVGIILRLFDLWLKVRRNDKD